MGLCFPEASIIVVDDELGVVRFLMRALNRAGYHNVCGFVDPTEVPKFLDTFTPDLVILDLNMPGMDGCEVLEDVCRRLPQDSFLPVLVVSGLDDVDSRLKAVRSGAKGFLAKPVDIKEFLAHVNSLLDTRSLSLRLNETRATLQRVIESQNVELRQAHMETLERLAKVAELRDDVTGQHTGRVGRLSALIAQEMHLSPEQVELILRAAPLHDLGKIAITDGVLLKSSEFAKEEREIMRDHVRLGAELLAGGRSEIIRAAEQIALCHHERWDGQGYPRGLAGSAIPILARIVAVADTFDALTHVRPYKEAWSIPDALDEIVRERGWQFDPEVVDALLRVQRFERGICLEATLQADS